MVAAAERVQPEVSSRSPAPSSTSSFRPDTCPRSTTASEVDIRRGQHPDPRSAAAPRQRLGARRGDELDRRSPPGHGRSLDIGAADHGSGRTRDAGPHPQRRRRADRPSRARSRRRRITRSTARPLASTEQATSGRGLRNRHQGHRPDRPLHQGRQDRRLRRRRRRQDGRHHRVDPQHRRRARRVLGLRGVGERTREGTALYKRNGRVRAFSTRPSWSSVR